MNKTPSEQFLTPEESAKVDVALLAAHEKFLTRLTVSSWRVLQQIAKDKGTAIESLSVEEIIAWFEGDAKVRQEQGSDAAFLKW